MPYLVSEKLENIESERETIFSNIRSLLNEASKLIKDEAEHRNAYKIYYDLANHGYTEAQHKLGEMYETGKFVSKDINKAKSYYLEGAKRFYWPSVIRLSLLYINDMRLLYRIFVFIQIL